MFSQEVCRLCLSKGNLLSVFDKQCERTEYLKDVIRVTTGVEIHSYDVISQKICATCSQDTVKMYQFRQQSLKNDRYLKAQCQGLLMQNTYIPNKLKRIDKEEKKQEPRCMPSYKVHPTMTALSRKYPELHFPSICVLSHVDPCVSMEMDSVENYFKNRNLNMKKYVELALTVSNKNIPKKISTIPKCSPKNIESSVKNRITGHVAKSISTAILKTLENTEGVNKVKPINIKLNESGYSIVRPSTGNVINGQVKNVCESTSSCEQLLTDSLESKSDIRKPKKRRLSDIDFLVEPETKKVSSVNPLNKISVLSNIEIKSPFVFKCNICSSIQFSAKHLKRHQIRHSRCKFCKIQFRSVEMKQQHINNSCFVKEALNKLPAVAVERIELNKEIRRHYPNAFTIFPPLPGLESISSKAAEEIIELTSDDEDIIYVLTSKPAKSICSKNPALTPSTVTPTVHLETALSSVIRPIVRLKNDTILDSINTPAPDLEIIKELLTKFKEQSVRDEATQIEPPTIRMDETNLSPELINLKQLLHSYQIPVEIQKGSKTSASYNYQRTRLKPNMLKLWNELTPIDVETESSLLSNRTSNSEHVITVTPATHSNIITNDSILDNRSELRGFVNNGQKSLQNISISSPATSDCSSFSSDSFQTNSPAISSIQIKSRIPTPECSSIVQAESQSSSSSGMQNGRKLLVPPQGREISPVQSVSPVTDMPNGIHSSKSPGSHQTTSTINTPSPEICLAQTIASIPSSRMCPGLDQTSLQNNAIAIPTSRAQCCVNSETPRKSPVQNKTDVNVDWKLLNFHSEVTANTIIASHDSTNSTIEYVVNNYNRSSDAGTLSVRPPNGVIYNNNNQPSSHISEARSKSTMIQWNQNVPQYFSKATTSFCNMNIAATANSFASNQNLYGNNTPVQKIALANNNVRFKPPPTYPNYSTPVNQRPQSYISSHISNVPQAVDIARTVQTADGNYKAFSQYIPRVQEFVSFQPIDGGAATFMPNAPMSSEAQHCETGHFPASNLLRNTVLNHSILQSPRISASFSCQGNKSSATCPFYSNESNYVNGSITVSSIDQNFDVSNRQLSNDCTYQSFRDTCDALPESVPPLDKSQHFVSGLIRVRNVRELT